LTIQREKKRKRKKKRKPIYSNLMWNLIVISKLVFEDCPYNGVSKSIPSFIHGMHLCPIFEEFGQQFIQFIDENFINYSLIVHEKSLIIPYDKEEVFDDNINFY